VTKLGLYKVWQHTEKTLLLSIVNTGILNYFIMTMKYSWSVFTIYSLGLYVLAVKSSLTAVPEDTTAVLGSTVQLTCRTDLRYAIKWIHSCPFSEGQPEIVYNGDHVLVLRYRERGFSVKRDNDYMNLTIRNVSYADAGRYTCIDDEGDGDGSSAELVVIEAELNCSDNTGAESKIIPSDLNCIPGPDIIYITCSIQYSGNIAPVLNWTITGTNDVISDVHNETVANEVARYSLLTTVNATMDQIGYSCQAWMPFSEHQHIDMMWTSSLYSVYYISASDSSYNNKTTRICSTTTNMRHCETELQLHNITDIDIHTLSVDELLQEGLGSCYTECKVGNRVCGITYRPYTSERAPDKETKMNLKNVLKTEGVKTQGVVFVITSTLLGLSLLSAITAGFIMTWRIRRRRILNTSPMKELFSENLEKSIMKNGGDQRLLNDRCSHSTENGSTSSSNA
jgi:hypothetical protein